MLSNTCQVQAQSSGAASDPLRSAVEKALLSNPDVASRFNAYRAAGDAVDVARGALRPRVDLNASVGIDKDKITSRQPESESLRRTGLGLSLTQLLWDGLGTQRELDRVSHDLWRSGNAEIQKAGRADHYQT